MVADAPMLATKASDDLCTGSFDTSARQTLSAGNPSHVAGAGGLGLDAAGAAGLDGAGAGGLWPPDQLAGSAWPHPDTNATARTAWRATTARIAAVRITAT
jgi:hypothetical protein